MIIPGREDKRTQERRQHSTAYIPYSFYLCWIPRFFPNVPMHWHSEFELNLVVRGEGEFTCGSGRFTGRPGDLFVIPPNQLHAAYPIQKGELVYCALVFHPNLLGANAGDRSGVECVLPLVNGTLKITPHITPDTAGYARLRACMDTALECVSRGDARGDMLLKSELLRLFWLLEEDEGLLSREQVREGGREDMRPAMEYLMEHFREEISLEELAKLSHLSKSYFMSCFKKAAGMSAMEYLAQLRVHAACEALSGSGARVSEIAYRCGYGNLSNFNRQFRRIAGCSPKEYRRQIGGGDSAPGSA